VLPDYIVVGKIGSPYGVRGWFKVQTFTEFGTSILKYSPLYMRQNNDEWRIITLEDGRPHGKGFILKIAGINTPEDARLLTGNALGITRAQLPQLKENEFYWSDLIGLTVVNKNGEIYGKVTDIMETGSNDVLVVKGKQEVAIPYLTGSVILNIDLEKQEILVDWELI
jgi:16S rRNA processing protein RimM